MNAATNGPSMPTANERWQALHPDGRDRPRISVWYPSEAPWARLQTIAHGCHEPDTLPAGPPIAYLTIGGVEFGGLLDELDLLLAAATETLGWVREQYEQMRAAEPKDREAER